MSLSTYEGNIQLILYNTQRVHGWNAILRR